MQHLYQHEQCLEVGGSGQTVDRWPGCLDVGQSGMAAIGGKQTLRSLRDRRYSGSEGDQIMRAIIEALGAYISSAPISDSPQGIKTRQIAFALVSAVFLVGVLRLLHR